MMNFDLPDEIVALRDVVRDFAAKEIRPYAREWDREQHLPDELVAKLGQLGLLGIMVPEQYGGAGQSYLANSAPGAYRPAGRRRRVDDLGAQWALHLPPADRG